MSCRNAIVLLWAVFILVLGLPAVTSSAEPPKPRSDLAELWLSRAGGIWEHNSKAGYYQVFVYREGIEHTVDRILVRMIEKIETGADDYATKVVRSFWIKDLLIKGYVSDIQLKQVSKRTLLSLDIEMKAMDGIVLKEVYILQPDGRGKLLSEARYVDVGQ